MTELNRIDLLEDRAVLIGRLEAYRLIAREALSQLHLSFRERDRLKALLGKRRDGSATPLEPK